MLELNFIPYPILKTERLDLTRPFVGEAEDFFEMRSDPEMMKFIPRPIAETLEDAKKLIRGMDEVIEEKSGVSWSIKMKGSERVIGHIGFYRTQHQHYRTELGYMLRRDFWGKGIISEATRAALDYAFFEMKVHSVEAVIDPANRRSGAVLERNHFIKEAHFRENFYWNGKFTDTGIYTLLKSRHLAMTGQVSL